MSPLPIDEPTRSPASALSSIAQTVARKAASAALYSHIPQETGLQLAHHVHALDAGELSSATREAAVRCVLDLLCAAAAGFEHSSARAARAAVSFFGPGEADVWFAGSTASPLAALLANSVASSAHDLDDG
jgi:2-methylcitrate dehydratase PrpD